ncbi:MAG: hypothetical protein V4857_24800 [Pseudomonadota bacterium]
MNDDSTRFRELCFLFVCNKLDDAETAWMRSMLLAHPELAAEVADNEAAAAQVRAGLAYSYQTSPPLLSFEEMMAAVNRDRPTRLALLRARVVQAWRMPPARAWSAGAAAMLVLGLSVQTYRLETVRMGERYRGVPDSIDSTQAGRQLLMVVFSDKLNVGELRALLAGSNLDIVGGPDEQGVMWLAVPDGGLEPALASLRANKAVLDVRVVSGQK